MEVKKKKFIDPVIWAKHSFVLVLIIVGFILLGLTAYLSEKLFGIDNCISNFLYAFVGFLSFIFFIILFAASIGGLISLIGLFVIKEKTKKPYVYSLISVLFGVMAIVAAGVSASYQMKQNAIIYPRVICHSKLRGLATAYSIYVYDNQRGSFANNWCDLFNGECDVAVEQFQCPADKTGPCSYAMNENVPVGANELPPDLVLLFESAPGWNQTGEPDDVVTDRHGEKKPGANIAFADGTVKFVEADKIPSLRWTIDNREK